MNPQAVSLGIVAFVIFGTIVFALFSVRKLTMDPQQYIVAGRSLGWLLLWLLLAGEIYTGFTFLGAAGWAYGRGAPAFYILAYGTVAYTIGYFLLPPIWRIGKERGLLTGPDFLLDRYGSRVLSCTAAVLMFVLVIPYVTLQLSTLQLLLGIAGYNRFDATAAVGVAFALIALFVFTAGLRGTAWASVVKDLLVLAAVIFAGVALPIRFFGSPAGAIDHVLAVKPHWFTLAVGNVPNNVVWYVSTVLLTGVGFFMGPANAPAVYSSRDENTLRRNMTLMPFYQLMLLLVFFAGFAALTIHPGLKGPAADQSFMLVVQKYYSPWILGFVAAAGSLAALLPASALLLGTAAVISKNVFGDVFGLATADRSRTLLTRFVVLAIAALALVLWLFSRTTLVELLLFYYNGVTQFFPAFVFALIWRRVNWWTVLAGIVAGDIVAFYYAIGATLSPPIATPFGLNPGFVGLIVNVALCVVLAFVFPRNEKPAVVTAGLSVSS